MKRGKTMKQLLAILLSLTLVLSLAACGEKVEVTPDYDVVAFEQALNNGENLTGKTVVVTVNELVPNSAFGYNIQAGEHLNFCSPDNPKVKVGDTITVKVGEVTSMLGSYIISYEMVK